MKDESFGTVPIRKNGQIQVLIIKHKNGSFFSFPKGHKEKDETDKKAAARELKEETGYISDQWHNLGTFHANPAVLNNTCHVFLALNSRKISDPDLDMTEDLESKLIHLNELVDIIEKDEIIHGISLASLLKFEFFKLKNPGLF